jgi:hypothetical protein
MRRQIVCFGFAALVAVSIVAPSHFAVQRPAGLQEPITPFLSHSFVFATH